MVMRISLLTPSAITSFVVFTATYLDNVVVVTNVQHSPIVFVVASQFNFGRVSRALDRNGFVLRAVHLGGCSRNRRPINSEENFDSRITHPRHIKETFWGRRV